MLVMYLNINTNWNKSCAEVWACNCGGNWFSGFLINDAKNFMDKEERNRNIRIGFNEGFFKTSSVLRFSSEESTPEEESDAVDTVVTPIPCVYIKLNST